MVIELGYLSKGQDNNTILIMIKFSRFYIKLILNTSKSLKDAACRVIDSGWVVPNGEGAWMFLRTELCPLFAGFNIVWGVANGLDALRLNFSELTLN